MATQNSINQGDSTRIFSGIQSWGGSGAYFDDTTLGTFTILRPGNGYIKGKPVSWTAPQTASSLLAGNTYYIYIDNTGAIQGTNTFSTALYTDNIVLFECLRDSTSPTNNQITVKETHPHTIEANTSIYLHKVIGTVIGNANNGANITLNGTQKIQINGADVLEDHGLETTVPDSGGVAVVFRKMFTNASGKWCVYTNTDTFAGNYNNAGTVTALTAGYFAVYTLYVSKDNLTASTPTYYAVLNTAQFNTLGQAQTAIANGTLALSSNELQQLELAQLGYIIYRQSTSAIVQVTVSKGTLKQTLSTAGTNQASLINTVTTSFNGILSASDTNVQSALDTIDNWGASTTNHAVIIGKGTGTALGATAVGSTGQILQGVSSNDPAWSTATYPSTVALGDVLVASGTNVVDVANGNLSQGYVLASAGSGSAPSFQSGGFVWKYSSGGNFSCPPNIGYLMNGVSDQTIFVSLVTTFDRTFAIEIIKVTAGYLTIEQQNSHQINISGVLTTAGTGHGVKSNTTGLKRIRLQYVDTNLWYVVTTNGTWVTY